MEIKVEPKKGLNLDTDTWEGMMNSYVLWATQEPVDFLKTVFLLLSPLLIISLVLSWRLTRILNTQKKENNKKNKKGPNVSKLRKNK